MKLSDWSKWVISRDGKCADCGVTERLRAFREGDGVCLCQVCHWKRHERKRVRVRGNSQRKKLEERIAELEAKIGEA